MGVIALPFLALAGLAVIGIPQDFLRDLFDFYFSFQGRSPVSHGWMVYAIVAAMFNFAVAIIMTLIINFQISFRSASFSFGEKTECIIMGPIKEELAFRGVPLLIFWAIGPFAIILAVMANIVWASLHIPNYSEDGKLAVKMITSNIFIAGMYNTFLAFSFGIWAAIISHSAYNAWLIMAENLQNKAR